MPYRLVHELQKLMTMEFTASKKDVLGGPDVDLPDEVWAQLEKIWTQAGRVFSPRLEPDHQQAYIMEKHGFPVMPGRVDMVAWKSGKIVTPRGMIYYPY